MSAAKRPIEMECMTCGALPHRRCTQMGTSLNRTHYARMVAAQQAQEAAQVKA